VKSDDQSRDLHFSYRPIRDWKHRSKPNKGKRYSIRIHRNYLNSKFDPVFWLLYYLSVAGIKEGPLFPDVSESSWADMSVTLFEEVSVTSLFFLFVSNAPRMTTPFPAKQAGLYTKSSYDDITGKYVPPSGCTNHSIRRSAAQWAGRCLGNVIDVKNNGRWKSMDQMSQYVAQGAVDRNRHIQDNKGTDPIWGIWVWKPISVAGEDGRNQM
jgi:hypothetical protein